MWQQYDTEEVESLIIYHGVVNGKEKRKEERRTKSGTKVEKRFAFPVRRNHTKRNYRAELPNFYKNSSSPGKRRRSNQA